MHTASWPTELRFTLVEHNINIYVLYVSEGTFRITLYITSMRLYGKCVNVKVHNYGNLFPEPLSYRTTKYSKLCWSYEHGLTDILLGFYLALIDHFGV